MSTCCEGCGRTTDNPRFCGRHIYRWVRERQQDRCALCHSSHWEADHYSGPVPLEMDHVDGDHRNDRPENLRMVRPTCHSLTTTYRARNTGRGRPWRRGAAG